MANKKVYIAEASAVGALAAAYGFSRNKDDASSVEDNHVVSENSGDEEISLKK